VIELAFLSARVAGALALAYSLGASRDPVDLMLEQLATLTGFPPSAVEVIELEPPEPLELEVLPLITASAWDPSSGEHILASRCRALLLEIIRRAAHDWILYRMHDRLHLRQVAEDAYIWLFKEGPRHPWTRVRETHGSTITSFLTICELLDLDPEFVRRKIRGMTVQQIMTAGRPAEHRHRRRRDREEMYVEHSTEVDLDGLGDRAEHSTSYESHFAIG
jgi:hypothetical protein